MTASIPLAHPRRWLVLALVLAAECMDLLDGTIVNVAAPTISASLKASSTALQWIIGGYALAFAVGLITGARLGDIYGRKRLFVIGAFGFVATSLACGAAVNPGMLIGCRLAQGLAAAMLIPQGLGILRDMFPPDERAKAFGLFGPVIGLSAVLGPILGGVLVDANLFGTGWRLVFFVNLPVGLAAAIGAAILMPESHSPGRRARLDLVGTAIAALAMGLLVYPLIQGRDAGWPLWTYAMMAGSVVGFVTLAVWSKRQQRTGRDPLIVSSIFSRRGYSAGLVTMTVFFGSLIGAMLVLTLFLQLGEHFSAIHAGLSLAPFAFGTSIGAVVGAAVLVPKIGRTTLQLGAAVEGAGVLWLYAVIGAHGLHTTTLQLIAPELLLGIGMGALVSPLFGVILASVTDAEVGSASGVVNAVQQLAGAVGVATIGTLFFSTVAHSGFVDAVRHCLLITAATAPVLIGLVFLLPHQPRDEESLLADTGPELSPVPA